MFGAGTILARSATPAPNMGVATEGSGAAKCVLNDVHFSFDSAKRDHFFIGIRI